MSEHDCMWDLERDGWSYPKWAAQLVAVEERLIRAEIVDAFTHGRAFHSVQLPARPYEAGYHVVPLAEIEVQHIYLEAE